MIEGNGKFGGNSRKQEREEGEREREIRKKGRDFVVPDAKNQSKTSISFATCDGR